MDALAIKIAELLDVSVSQAVKMYPYLRQQMIYYNILGNLELIVFILFLGACATTFFLSFPAHDRYDDFEEEGSTWYDEKKQTRIRKEFKFLIKFIVISWVVFLVAFLFVNIAKPMLAPDIMLIKSFL